MSFAAVASTSEPRKVSFGGPLKAEFYTYSAASADTSGTITSKNMHAIYQVLMDGLTQSAAATFSGNVATITFVDPAATVYGSIILIGV